MARASPLLFNRVRAKLHLVEQTYIGILMMAVGEDALVQQLHEEHKAIGCYFESGASRSSSEPENLGHLLEQRVRFEERKLFNVAQTVLSMGQLRSLTYEIRALFSLL